MNRGDVYWHKFREPDKRRPVLIITRDGAISDLSAVTVVPATTNIRNLRSQVLLTEEEGMPETCVVNLDWIQTLPKEKLGDFITHIADDRMEEVFEAIKFAFGFDK